MAQTITIGVPEKSIAGIEASARRHHRVLFWPCLGVLIACYMLQTTPEGRVALLGLKEHPLPGTCLSHELLGVSCPACGLTRSFIHLAHGRFAESLRLHRLGP